jgi:H+/gluconate symporter-like permease
MKHRLVAGIGFLLLSITVVALLVFAITQAQQHPQVMISGTQVSPGVIGSVIVIGLLLGTLIEMAFEVQRLADVTLASVICREHGSTRFPWRVARW